MRVSQTVMCVLVVVGLAAASANSPLGAEQHAKVERKETAARLIAQLDACVQERFKDVNELFGLSRIIKIGDAPHRFQPENVREESVVRGLEQARVSVILYVASRRVLGDPPPWFSSTDAWWGVKGPVRVTTSIADRVSQRSEEANPPSGSDLLAESRRAFAAFEKSESLEFVQSGWTMTARPVRASSEACLRCHRRRDEGGAMNPRSSNGATLRVGDVIGVVMYGHRSGQ